MKTFEIYDEAMERIAEKAKEWRIDMKTIPNK